MVVFGGCFYGDGYVLFKIVVIDWLYDLEEYGF